MVCIGSSAQPEAGQAGREAAQRAQEGVPSSRRLALVFGSSWFHQESLLNGVRSVLGEIELIGASTAGEITPDGPTSHSCVVVLMASDTVEWGLGMGLEVDRNPRQAGQRAAFTAAQALHGRSRVGFLLLGDGLATRYTEVTRGIQEVLGTRFLIAGGIAGDDLRFSQTYQYWNQQVVSRAVVGVLLGGSLKMGVGIQHGFAPISKPRHITRANANVLYELDRRPAASVYEEYFGQELVQRMQEEGLTRQGSMYPLGIQGDRPDQWLLRTVLSLQEDGSLLLSDEIPEDAWIQLMIGSKQLTLDAAYRAAQQAIRPLNRVAVALVFDSFVRRKFLGWQYAALEVARIRQALGPATPLAGCYTYGEQGSLDRSDFDGQTAVQTGSVLVVALGT